MTVFDVIHNPYRPEPSPYYVKRKQLVNPLIDVIVILTLTAVLLLTGYMHI